LHSLSSLQLGAPTDIHFLWSLCNRICMYLWFLGVLGGILACHVYPLSIGWEMRHVVACCEFLSICQPFLRPTPSGGPCAGVQPLERTVTRTKFKCRKEGKTTNTLHCSAKRQKGLCTKVLERGKMAFLLRIGASLWTPDWKRYEEHGSSRD
jgi:hypothetical protein